MKKILYKLFLLFVVLSFSSCLDSNLDELPVYEEADITSVSAVQYRYLSDKKSPASGEFIVEEVNLQYTGDIDADHGTVKIEVEKPSTFPAAQVNNLSKSNLVVVVTLSTAARLTPAEGSPILGVPADWSKAHKYIVTSASGKKKEWTIEVVSLTK